MSRVCRSDGSGGNGACAEKLTDIGPDSTVAGLDAGQLVVLRQVGDHRGGVLGPGKPGCVTCRSIRVFTVPLTLNAGRGRGRFAAIDFLDTAHAGEISPASTPAQAPHCRQTRYRDAAC
jgi:hypothetical protein